jgi:hypothetical protein
MAIAGNNGRRFLKLDKRSVDETQPPRFYVRPAKADAFSGRQTHRGKSQRPLSLDSREEGN